MPESNGGYVRIYRSILKNPASRNVVEAMFFAFLVLKANWRAGERRYDERVYKLKRGDLVLGERKLAEGFGWSRQKLRGVLSRFIAADMLTRNWDQHGDQRAPVITVCNYDIYQAPTETDKPTSEPSPAQGRTKAGPPKKEGKEGKEKKERNSPPEGGGDLSGIEEADFETWYDAYPRKVARGAALKAYRAARKKTDAMTLLIGVGVYQKTKPDYADWKHPATWLNGECWLDETVKESAGPYGMGNGYI